MPAKTHEFVQGYPGQYFPVNQAEEISPEVCRKRTFPYSGIAGFALVLFILKYAGAHGPVPEVVNRGTNPVPMNRYSAGHDSSHADKQKQEAWIQNVLKNRPDFEEGLSEARPSINDSPGFQQVKYRIRNKAVIVCQDRERIILVTHSMHQDSSIGDIAVAWVDAHTAYLNYGHICGGLVNYISEKPEIPEDGKDFFSRFYTDTDNQRWIRRKE